MMIIGKKSSGAVMKILTDGRPSIQYPSPTEGKSEPTYSFHNAIETHL